MSREVDFNFEVWRNYVKGYVLGITYKVAPGIIKCFQINFDLVNKYEITYYTLFKIKHRLIIIFYVSLYNSVILSFLSLTYYWCKVNQI